MSTPHQELADLLAALCDDRLSAPQAERIEELVIADPEALRFYINYIDLHGMLHWDAAGGAVACDADAAPLLAELKANSQPQVTAWIGLRSRTARIAAAVIATTLLIAVGLWAFRGVEDNTHLANGPVEPGSNLVTGPQPDGTDTRPPQPRVHRPIHLPEIPGRNVVKDETHHPQPVVPENTTPPAIRVAKVSNAEAIARINSHIATVWQDYEVKPSPTADDAEWVRRVHLDLVGHIPQAEVVSSFLADKSTDKRERLVDELLDDSEFARHFASTWTNLLIGHASTREVNRPALAKFLREQFHHNRPWTDTVTQLVSAEGYDDEQGATNFLLAHLNNEAVPATAVTCRVLLCEQVQCTQCHHHPTAEWKQDRFWEFNAFFQQTEVVRHSRTDKTTGQRLPDRLELVSKPVGGPTFYENRQGEMKVAYPEFSGSIVAQDEEVNRREELARLITAQDDPQLARAFINRTWGTFFGHGFTTPIDDMGPHTPVSHPELLADLTNDFIASGYDIKRLIRWVCLSEPYQLSSHPSPENLADNPEQGHVPLFSRMYVRPLSAEQLFDSLLVATQADRAGTHYWGEVEERRAQWLDQFYTALENDENAETSEFGGSLTETLVMMNGDLIQRATSTNRGTILHQVATARGDETDKIKMLSLATLSRYPSSQELSRIRRVIRQAKSDSAGKVQPLEDLMWAYLNSTEFRSNH